MLLCKMVTANVFSEKIRIWVIQIWSDWQRTHGHYIVWYSRECIQRKAFNRYLTHWGRVTHICVRNLTTIGSDNGLSPGRRQAIIRTNAGILLIEPLGTNFNEILIEIHVFSFKKIHFKMSSGKWRPFCLGLNVLTCWKDSRQLIDQ